VFRNLDLKRTVWKNLTNWNEQEKRLYVDRLYYKHTGRKKLPTQLLVVVDQSGSMVNSMVPCAIIASIFAGLPHVDVHLIAYDTQVIDLTDYVHDPFEVLMRTKLGGGNDTCLALEVACAKIRDPRLTALVLISDFYEGANDQRLFNDIKAIVETGIHFIPVGSVDSSGDFRVNPWFRERLKEYGKPILTGAPRHLIAELKKLIVV
jgi:predicted metal-dependent peptidase